MKSQLLKSKSKNNLETENLILNNEQDMMKANFGLASLINRFAADKIHNKNG